MDAIETVVASYPFGRASAAKRGRRQEWPFVPVIDHGEQAIGVHRTRTEQIKGKAFATREEAVAYAQACIDARRESFRHKLRDPCHRALREQWGLPREIAA